MKLVTNDDQQLEVDEGIVSMFNVLKNMMQDLGTSETDDPVPVQVTSKVLQQIVTWCEHHKDDSPEESQLSDESSDEEYGDVNNNNSDEYRRDKQYDVDLDPWDEDFLRQLDPEDEDAVFPLIVAANFLDIPKLLDTCCKYVAEMLRGRTAQWIRKRFKLTCDFTDEQKAKIRQELSWYDEDIKLSDDEDSLPPLTMSQ